MACSLSLRSFLRQYSSSLRADAGVGAGSALQSGSTFKTIASVSVTDSPGNARFPLSNSNSTAPNDQISQRRSTVLPRACSGAMYAAVPRIMPAVVAPNVNVGELEGSEVF